MKAVNNASSLLKLCKQLYIRNDYAFDIEKRSELFELFKDLFQEVVLALNMMKANDLIKYINYEILKTNDNLFEYLKRKVLKEEMKPKNIKTADVDEIVDRCIARLQSDKSINYSVLVIEQLKQFYNLQATQVTIWNEEGGNKIFRNDSEKFTEHDEEFAMNSELFMIEDKFKERDNQYQQSEGPLGSPFDHEIIPVPNRYSKYENKGRLKLDIMDLEEDSEQTSTRDRKYPLDKELQEFGKLGMVIIFRKSQKSAKAEV